MGKKILCPECKKVVLAEWIEKQRQFKVVYSKEERDELKKHSFARPINSTCFYCKEPICITDPVTTTTFCPCRVGTSDYFAKPLSEKEPPGRWFMVRLASVLKSIDCLNTKVRCRGCQHELYLLDYMVTGKSLGTPSEQDWALEDFIDKYQSGDSSHLTAG